MKPFLLAVKIEMQFSMAFFQSFDEGIFGGYFWIHLIIAKRMSVNYSSARRQFSLSANDTPNTISFSCDTF